MKPSDYCIITTTTDSKDNANAIIEVLLQKELTAYVQSSNIYSSYKWQGKIISSEEITLQIRTKIEFFNDIKREIEKIHTYDVPEIIMLPLLNASQAYLKWIEQETSSKATESHSIIDIPKEML